MPVVERVLQLERVEQQLRSAATATPQLIAGVIAEACVRFAAHQNAAKARIARLIDAGAWTDAMLGLVEMELPYWRLGRLVLDDGLWLCALSRHPQLPIECDDLVEASHEELPLAILMALVQARQATESGAKAAVAPSVRGGTPYAVCCDNFA